MTQITIKTPEYIDCDIKEWNAAYRAEGQRDVRLVRIESRSAVEVIVAKISQETILGTLVEYYISSPNFRVAIPGISTLYETHWITEQLLNAELPAPDAVTVAQVLRDMGDF